MKTVKRFEDMSPTGCLELTYQPDGDVQVCVSGVDTRDKTTFAMVEFCLSGGQSPNTLKALWNLMEAMQKDNEENEQFKDAERIGQAMRRLTKEQAAIIGAYTGVTCGNFADIHEYAEKIMGRPIWTHEFASEALAEQLRQKSKADFLAICHEVVP